MSTAKVQRYRLERLSDSQTGHGDREKMSHEAESWRDVLARISYGLPNERRVTDAPPVGAALARAGAKEPGEDSWRALSGSLSSRPWPSRAGSILGIPQSPAATPLRAPDLAAPPYRHGAASPMPTSQRCVRL